MKELQAIQTEYSGHLFRSRTEAKWAVFLDMLQIDWRYEDEGYILSNGVWYLPDFYLPTFDKGMFLEIKPESFTKEEREKCELLCLQSGLNVWLADGLPAVRGYEYLTRHSSKGEPNEVVSFVGAPNCDQAYRENRMYGNSPYYMPEPHYMIPKYFQEEHYVNAVKEARQARFEHKNKKHE